MSKEAMKLALEALNTTESDCGSRAWEREQEAITALLEALAEQPAQQEPVTPCTHPSLGFSSLREDGAASRWSCVMCGTEFVPKTTQRWTEFNEATKRNIEHAEWYLSTHPQPAQQEPVAWMLEWAFNGEERGYRLYDDERHCVFDAESDGGVCRPLYTSPQPAQRKPLTDEQREEIAKGWRGRNWTVGDIIDAIEAAQGIGEKK